MTDSSFLEIISSEISAPNSFSTKLRVTFDDDFVQLKQNCGIYYQI